MPLEPIAFWIEGEEWRAISFDESRLDDTTHGAGGDRKGRTERCIRYPFLGPRFLLCYYFLTLAHLLRPLNQVRTF